MLWSSQMTGTCEMTSIGEMLPAMTQILRQSRGTRRTQHSVVNRVTARRTSPQVARAGEAPADWYDTAKPKQRVSSAGAFPASGRLVAHPFVPFLSAFTTSFTPRLTCLPFAAAREEEVSTLEAVLSLDC